MKHARFPLLLAEMLKGGGSCNTHKHTLYSVDHLPASRGDLYVLYISSLLAPLLGASNEVFARVVGEPYAKSSRFAVKTLSPKQ